VYSPVLIQADWNTTSERIVAEQGFSAPGMHKYRAAKTMAEREAWRFVQEKKPTFDLVAILPTAVCIVQQTHLSG
jgi:hypothetical protein